MSGYRNAIEAAFADMYTFDNLKASFDSAFRYSPELLFEYLKLRLASLKQVRGKVGANVDAGKEKKLHVKNLETAESIYVRRCTSFSKLVMIIKKGFGISPDITIQVYEVEGEYQTIMDNDEDLGEFDAERGIIMVDIVPQGAPPAKSDKDSHRSLRRQNAFKDDHKVACFPKHYYLGWTPILQRASSDTLPFANYYGGSGVRNMSR